MNTASQGVAPRRLCAGRRRPGTVLQLRITDTTQAHLETIKTLARDVLGVEPSHSLAVRLAVRCLADTFHRLSVAAEGQRQRHGKAIAGPEEVALKLALVECRGAAR